ncbi:MAG: PQQ-dependent sugar dehydrogenase [Thermoplasmatota archaeon]
MRVWPLLLCLLVTATALAGCSDRFEWPDVAEPGAVDSFRDDLALVDLADGLTKPVQVLPLPGDDAGRLAVVEQQGTVQALAAVGTPEGLLLDLRDRTAICHLEQGLLSIAFDPAQPRRLYAAYTGLPCDDPGEGRIGDLHISRFPYDPTTRTADAAAEEVLLTVGQPFRNHNGGHLLFGPDGHLYIGVGDGGDHDDPHENGQDLTTLLGALLRIDVSGPLGSGYRIPLDNPFTTDAGARDEIWAYGLRNPWRMAFDPATGDLWIADVGQNRYEEVNHLPAGSGAGANLGWDLYEGNSRHEGSATPDVVWPVAQYPHKDGQCSISGGPVVRGGHYPGLDGAYLFADFCTGRLWAAHLQGDGQATIEPLMDTGLQVTGFGQDADGRVYLTHWGGAVRQLVALGPGAGSS